MGRTQTHVAAGTVYAAANYTLLKVKCVVIRESVDSLCRDGADTQCMQYLSKSRITSP